MTKERQVKAERDGKIKRILAVLRHIEDMPDIVIDILYGMLCG